MIGIVNLLYLFLIAGLVTYSVTKKHVPTRPVTSFKSSCKSKTTKTCDDPEECKCQKCTESQPKTPDPETNTTWWWGNQCKKCDKWLNRCDCPKLDKPPQKETAECDKKTHNSNEKEPCWDRSSESGDDKCPKSSDDWDCNRKPQHDHKRDCDDKCRRSSDDWDCNRKPKHDNCDDKCDRKPKHDNCDDKCDWDKKDKCDRKPKHNDWDDKCDWDKKDKCDDKCDWDKKDKCDDKCDWDKKDKCDDKCDKKHKHDDWYKKDKTHYYPHQPSYGNQHNPYSYDVSEWDENWNKCDKDCCNDTSDIDSVTDQCDNKECDLEELKKEVCRVTDRLTKCYQTKIEDCHRKKEKLAKELKECQCEKKELAHKYRKLHSELTKYYEEKKHYPDEVHRLRYELKQCKDEHEHCKKRVCELEVKNKQLLYIIEGFRRKCNLLERENYELRCENNHLKEKIRRLVDILKKLRCQHRPIDDVH